MRAAWIGLLAAVCVGCGSGTERLPVTGTVTYKSEPLDGGLITFFGPGEGKGQAAGAGLVAGRFDLPTAQGLEPGTYRVEVSRREPGGVLTPEEKAAGASAKAREVLPAKYNRDSKLTVTVEAGKKNDFPLVLD